MLMDKYLSLIIYSTCFTSQVPQPTCDFQVSRGPCLMLHMLLFDGSSYSMPLDQWEPQGRGKTFCRWAKLWKGNPMQIPQTIHDHCCCCFFIFCRWEKMWKGNPMHHQIPPNTLWPLLLAPLVAFHFYRIIMSTPMKGKYFWDNVP